MRRYIFGVLSCVFLLTFVQSCRMDLAEERDCGIIKYKIDATRFSKHNAYSDPIFVINFEKRGIKEIHPTWNDYMSHNVGDTICYQMSKYGREQPWTVMGILFSMIFFLVCLGFAIFD